MMDRTPVPPPATSALPKPNWPAMLRAAADPVLASVDWSRPFADDAGNTRPIDAMLIARLRGRPAPPLRGSLPATQPDLALWHALASNAPPERTDAVLAAARAEPRSSWGGDSGALFPQSGIALEVWTETDLAALHALWWLARTHHRPDWEALVRGASAWHLDNIQPDNATAHPWAVHLFALAGATNPHARLYAETLLHNCQVSLGRPDKLSALILLDAACAIEAAS